MNKQIALKLMEKAEEIAVKFSNPDREKNYNKETFKVEKIIPMSEKTAVIVFDKNTGKKAMVFAFWLGMNEGFWSYFFPTESHIVGMGKVTHVMQSVEEFNFKLNKPQTEVSTPEDFV